MLTHVSIHICKCPLSQLLKGHFFMPLPSNKLFNNYKRKANETHNKHYQKRKTGYKHCQAKAKSGRINNY